MLFFYDNFLGKYEILQSFVICLNLIVFILYDIFFSFKKNYRYYVVNSIWILKVLDYYVVFDEEIIEDVVFGGQFGILNLVF